MTAFTLKRSVPLMLLALSMAACTQESATSPTTDSAADNGSQTELASTAERAGYAIGVNIGSGLQNQQMAEDISVDALVMGIRDTLNGEQKLTDEEMQLAVQELTSQMEARYMAEMEIQAEAQRQFLVENGQQEGVTTTDSGLQYSVLEQGAADGQSPVATDTVNVHYHGTLIDGTVFDSSVERGEPISFPLNGVIAGWTEGLQLMKVGDKFRFFIPSDLAYGPQGAGGVIGPNATLIFDVELLAIEADAE